MEWYYADASDNQVTVDESQLEELVASLKIKPTTLVWNESMTEWKACSEVRPDLFSGESTPPPFSPTPNQPVLEPAGPGYTPQPSATSGIAVCSLVFGILGVLLSFGCTPFVCSIPAIICGHIARKKVKAGTIAASNNGLALTGLITGYIGLVISLIFVGFIITAAVLDSQGMLE